LTLDNCPIHLIPLPPAKEQLKGCHTIEKKISYFQDANTRLSSNLKSNEMDRDNLVLELESARNTIELMKEAIMKDLQLKYFNVINSVDGYFLYGEKYLTLPSDPFPHQPFWPQKAKILHEDSLNQYQNITFSTLYSKMKHKASIESVFLDPMKLKKWGLKVVSSWHSIFDH